jgi:hypothetical protein
MGYLQILATAASMVLTYGGVAGTDALLERIASAIDIAQPAPPVPEQGEDEEP